MPVLGESSSAIDTTTIYNTMLVTEFYITQNQSVAQKDASNSQADAHIAMLVVAGILLVVFIGVFLFLCLKRSRELTPTHMSRESSATESRNADDQEKGEGSNNESPDDVASPVQSDCDGFVSRQKTMGETYNKGLSNEASELTGTFIPHKLTVHQECNGTFNNENPYSLPDDTNKVTGFDDESAYDMADQSPVPAAANAPIRHLGVHNATQNLLTEQTNDSIQDTENPYATADNPNDSESAYDMASEDCGQDNYNKLMIAAGPSQTDSNYSKVRKNKSPSSGLPSKRLSELGFQQQCEETDTTENPYSTIDGEDEPMHATASQDVEC